jgi:hypothetical protein
MLVEGGEDRVANLQWDSINLLESLQATTFFFLFHIPKSNSSKLKSIQLLDCAKSFGKLLESSLEMFTQH